MTLGHVGRLHMSKVYFPPYSSANPRYFEQDADLRFYPLSFHKLMAHSNIVLFSRYVSLLQYHKMVHMSSAK